MSTEKTDSLDRLFYPKNVAVVGASPKRNGRGNRWIGAYIRFNFNGKIYPVHPKAETVLGCTAYKNVRDIPEDVDLITFAIPFSSVLDVMKDCVEKRVKYVHLFTAGFSETGEKENARLEREIYEVAREGGVRIIGPNCMGLYCPEGRISWAEDFPKKPGPVAFVSQSGQLAYQFVTDGGREGLRFSKVVSYGNASDLKIHDFLEYLAEDDDTKIVAAYLEGLTHGREFFEAAKRVTAKKPLIIFKGGQTEGGARATQSHTASIAGSVKIWDSICRQAGIIQVNSQEELVFTTLGFLRIEQPQGNRVAILGGAGGGSVTMTDISEKEGLKVPQLAPETVRELSKIVPMSGNSVNNPMDMAFSD
ncbi:MAG: hypothetical protein GY866_06265, partial [Proteobacteria bacterium]|nr:hypothetical protein [Pseudomonadota bacterium]